MSELLDITDFPRFDETVSKKQYHTYSPFIESFSPNDTIQICVQHQDLILLPSESFLYVEGTLTDETNNAVDTIKLTNNCVGFMFEEIRYELNSIEIDRTKNVGISTCLKNYISLNSHESTSLTNAGWKADGDRVIKTSNGHFNFCIPLNRLLGFAEDYKKIIPNAKHELILIRAKSNDNSVKTSLAKYKFNIKKINWKVPHITLSDAERLKLYQTIQSSRPLQISFRSWDLYHYPNVPVSTQNIWRVKTSNQLEKPRFVIFALQTNKLNNLNANPSEFSTCNLNDVKVYLNSEVYPYDNLHISFNEDRFALLYHLYITFQEAYYGRNSCPLLNPTEFKEIAPIAVIDCRYQNEQIKNGPIDVKIEFETSDGGILPNTSAFCLLLHDRIFEYSPLSGDVRKLV